MIITPQTEIMMKKVTEATNKTATLVKKETYNFQEGETMSKKNASQNGRKFYIADTHFGHRNIINIDQRPFIDTEHMDKEIMKRWNQVVSKYDHVYVIGDFAYKNTLHVSYYTTYLNGHIHLIRGNHDKQSEEYENCFESVDEILRIKDTVYVHPDLFQHLK